MNTPVLETSNYDVVFVKGTLKVIDREDYVVAEFDSIEEFIEAAVSKKPIPVTDQEHLDLY